MCSTPVVPSDTILDGFTTALEPSDGRITYSRKLFGATLPSAIELELPTSKETLAKAKATGNTIARHVDSLIDTAKSTLGLNFFVQDAGDPHHVLQGNNSVLVKESDQDTEAIDCLRALCAHNAHACPSDYCTLVTPTVLENKPRFAKHSAVGQCVPTALGSAATPSPLLADALMYTHTYKR